jgi:SAM-dependent methyltransferase
MTIDRVDFQIPEAVMYRGTHLKRTDFWDDYFDTAVHSIFQKGGLILDIGGGLRIDASKGDKLNEVSWNKFKHYLSQPNVHYKVTDYTDQYHPDYVEDIHKLSFPDNSIDSLFCLAVLEHVYDPKRAAEELIRVLKFGGKALLYVPFIYRYHANVTSDYKDYFRYSKDGIAFLFRTCSTVEICPVRGLFESLLRFTPLHTFRPLQKLLRFFDWHSARMRLISERQSSGYFITIVK